VGFFAAVTWLCIVCFPCQLCPPPLGEFPFPLFKLSSSPPPCSFFFAVAEKGFFVPLLFPAWSPCAPNFFFVILLSVFVCCRSIQNCHFVGKSKRLARPSFSNPSHRGQLCPISPTFSLCLGEFSEKQTLLTCAPSSQKWFYPSQKTDPNKLRLPPPTGSPLKVWIMSLAEDGLSF